MPRHAFPDVTIYTDKELNGLANKIQAEQTKRSTVTRAIHLIRTAHKLSDAEFTQMVNAL